jgi:hypothetical protein
MIELENSDKTSTGTEPNLYVNGHDLGQ